MAGDARSMAGAQTPIPLCGWPARSSWRVRRGRYCDLRQGRRRSRRGRFRQWKRRRGCNRCLGARQANSVSGRRLVAAIEIASPANKDRPEHRRAFAAKCAALLQNQISLVIIDLVTTRSFNLYRDLLDLIGESDPALSTEPMPIYSVACRATKPDESWQLDTWLHPLQIGQPLPTLPLWLADNFSIALDLEESYEDTCKALRLG
jgi:hypothetical protein